MERQREREMERGRKGEGQTNEQKDNEIFFCCVGCDKPTAAGSCAPAGGDCKRDRDRGLDWEWE